MTPLNPFMVISNIRDFLEMGGGVLWALLVLCFLLWVVALHYWFYLRRPITSASVIKNSNSDYQKWHQQRFISQMQTIPRHAMAWLKLIVKLAPLLGLLGTVTGMVQVFEVIAISGTSNARALAEGIARATLPTMAGMVVAVIGLLFIALLERETTKFLGRIKMHLRVPIGEQT